MSTDIITWKRGDIVTCKYREKTVVPKTDLDYEGKIDLKIVGFKIGPFGVAEFVVWVPEHQHEINGQIVISKKLSEDYQIDQKFLGLRATYIRSSNIVDLKLREDGIACVKCKTFHHMAAPNQSNGTMLCYSCRENPYR